MAEYRYNSADNHLDQRWIPRDLWQARVSHRFKANAPRVVEDADGVWWSWEGKLAKGRDGGVADGPDNARILEEFYGPSGVAVPAGSLPPADPRLVLAHMDLAGIYAYVGYASVRKWDIEDTALRHEVHRIYNDWMMELNAVEPDRLLYLPILPTFDPEACAAEIERRAKGGAKSVEFPVFDAKVPVWHEAWEPTWAVAAETGVVLCAHIGDKAGATYPPIERGVRIAYFSTVPFSAAAPIAQMTFSGVFQRHPKLKFNFGECRAGWAPMLLYWMDRQAVERPDLYRLSGLDLRPSDYVRRQVTVTFEEDDIAGLMLQHDESLLRDIVMWGADYPHPQGVWPDVDPVIDRIFAGIDAKLRREIVFDRCLRVFNLNGPLAVRSAD